MVWSGNLCTGKQSVMEKETTTFFVGEFTHALDSKGRVTIPSKWRISGGREYLPGSSQSRWLHNGVPPQDGKSVSRKKFRQRQASAMSGLRRSLWNYFQKPIHLGATSKGESTLNDKLLAHAGIKGKAVLVGNFSAFAIWSVGRYEKRPAEDQRNIFDAMRELGL